LQALAGWSNELGFGEGRFEREQTLLPLCDPGPHGIQKVRQIRFRPRSKIAILAIGRDAAKCRAAAHGCLAEDEILAARAIHLPHDHRKMRFNKFFPKGRKLFRDLLDRWMSSPESKIRLFDVSGVDYLAMTPDEKSTAREKAVDKFEERFRIIFQRRHDCIHNCDRPRISPQPLDKGGTVLKVIEDVEYLVLQCDAHINREFRQFPVNIGCSAATIAQAGY
jgi:hypothetical protein